MNGTVPWMPAPAATTYDDSTWELIDIPHDYEIYQNYSSGANQGEAFIPYNTSFYRKHFSVPSEWQGTKIQVRSAE